MSFGGPKNRRRFSPRRSPSWENYGGLGSSDDEDEMKNDVFNIPTKKAPLERLRKWRQATLALNASRRFRYTLDLKGAEEREQIIRKIRASAQAVRAFYLFKKGVLKPKKEEEAPPEGFGIGPTTLANLVRDHDLNSLQQLGEVNQVANLLHTDLEKGITDVPEEIQCRVNAYGENSYPRKASRNFFVFVWEALQDTTLISLMVCAVLSLVLGIKTEVSFTLILLAALSLVLGIETEGSKEGPFDCGSIFFAVIIVILVTVHN